MMAQKLTRLSVVVFLFLTCAYFIARDACLTPTAMIGHDASVFAAFGSAWLDGLIPYRDLFDHKGPVIFFLSMLGFWLGGDFYGIVYIEIFNLFLFSALFLSVNRNNTIVYYFFFLLIYCVFMAKNLEGGNLTEEYALLFNGISAYAWLTRTRWRFFLYGFSGALLVFMKMNLAALSLCIFLVDVGHSKNFIKHIFQCFLGFILPSGIMVLYFYSHDLLYEFYWSYIVCNIKYIEGGGPASLPYAYALFLAKNWIFFSLCVLMLIYIYLKKKAYFRSSLLFLGVPFLFAGISGRTYAHYILAVAPSAFILFSVIFKEKHTDQQILYIFLRHASNHRRRILAVCYSFIVILVLSLTVFSVGQRFDTQRLQSLRASFHEVGITPHSRILNLGGTLLSSIYHLSQTHPPVKEFFPLATMATAPMRRLLKNQQDICPDENYDFLLLAGHQRLSPGCPYVPVTTGFTKGKLYKYSPRAVAGTEDHEK